METQSTNNSKLLIFILLVIHAAMLAMLFTPVLAESDQYKLAREKLAAEPDSRDMATWDNEVVKRDMQVSALSGMIVWLFIHSFVLVELINRSLSEGEGFIGKNLAPARGGLRIIFARPGPMVTFSASLSLAITAGIALAMAYNRPSPMGLWAMILCVASTTACVFALIWANKANQKQTA